MTSPENEQLFSLFVTEIPFTFSYTRESTDFSDYAFTLDLCRDQGLMTDCIDPVLVSSVPSNEDEDESGAFLPTVTKLQPISSLGLLGLLIPFVLMVWFFLRQEKRSQLASVSMLTLFALGLSPVLATQLAMKKASMRLAFLIKMPKMTAFFSEFANKTQYSLQNESLFGFKKVEIGGREKVRFTLFGHSLALFAFLILGGVLGGVLSCTETLTEQVTRGASPELTGTAAIPIEISADALGAYYYRITATRADDDTAEPETQSGQIFYGWEVAPELNLTAVTLNAGDTVGAPILVEGATSYSLSGCDGFTIDSSSGQMTVASLPTSSAPQNCTLTIAGGANPLILGLTIDYEDIVFGMESYSFSLFNNAPMDEDVGDPVTATSLDRTAVTYSLDSCTGFTIDGTSGQISTAADNPTPGTINCTVTATTAGDTNSIEVEIIVNTDVLTFGMAPYSFSLFSNAVMDENVGDPVTATSLDGGAVSYTLGPCTGFQINSTSGQISTTADNPAIGTSNCMVTARRTAVTTAQIAVEIVVNNAISFDEESYTFVVLETASADDDVGDAITATLDGGGTVTYSLACTGFEIDETSGQISVMTARPAVGARNCMVTATSGVFTASIPVTINVMTIRCTATGLPENGAANTVALGPQDDSGFNCDIWQITANHPASASDLMDQVRVYRLEGLTGDYFIHLMPTLGPTANRTGLILVNHQEASITSDSDGITLTFVAVTGSIPAQEITITGTQYHINFETILEDTTMIVTVRPR